MRHFIAILILPLLMLYASYGCGAGQKIGSALSDTKSLLELNTRVKQFVVMPDKSNPEATYDNYKISVVIQAARAHDLAGTDSFRVTINSGYDKKVGSLEQARQVNPIRIDSLVLDITDCGFDLRPKVSATDADELVEYPLVRGKDLLGPDYLYELVRIPDRCKHLTLSYRVNVIDRQTGDVIRSRTFTHKLERIEELKYYP